MEQMEKKELMMDISSDTVANLEDNRTEISQEEYEAHLKEKVSDVVVPIKDKVSTQIKALEEQLLRAKEEKYDKEEEIAALEIQIAELEKQNADEIIPRYFKSSGINESCTIVYKTKSVKRLLANGFIYVDKVGIIYDNTMNIYQVDFTFNQRFYYTSRYTFTDYDEITEAEYNNIKKKAMDAIAK